MDTALLFKCLSTYTNLSEAFKEAVEKELVILQPPKNYLLVEAGSIASQLYFLNQGFVMAYSLEGGKKVTKDFFKAGQCISAFESFFEQRPSKEFLQIIVSSELISISYQSLQKLLHATIEAPLIYQGAINHRYTNSLKRIHELQRLSVAQRFENLLNEFSDIQQLASQGEIASYLNITAQSLSRLKKRQSNTENRNPKS